MTIRRIRMWLLLTIILSLIFCGLSVLTACADNSGESTGAVSKATKGAAAATSTNPDTEQTSSMINNSGTIPKDVPSGALRLYCLPRATLNPLADRSASFISISRLVYEGLYRIDHQGNTIPVLAKSAVVSEDGFWVDITLAEGRVFHNGAAVTAQDVVASFNFIRSVGAASAYAGRQTDIATVTAADTRSVRIGLTKPQANFAFQLIFPVIPTASLVQSKSKPLTIMPGSGPYTITGFQAGVGLTLALSERNEGWQQRTVKHIFVREYKDRHEAMRAFERDEIDLIDLPPVEYPIYAIRNGLKIERYWSEKYVFLAFNTTAGNLLENTGRLSYIKAICTDRRFLDGSDELGIYPAQVPILPDSALWSSTPTEDASFDSLYQTGKMSVMGPKLLYTATRKALIILAPEGDTLRISLASRLAALLTEKKIVNEVRILPPDAFLAARLGRQYDILMAQAIVPDSMDPRWLFGQNPDAGVVGSETLSRTGLVGYTAASAAVDARFQAGTAQVGKTLDNAALLRKAADLGPFAGIGFRYAALCSGSRVLGQLRPQMQHLYEGIEELWIWSTSSS